MFGKEGSDNPEYININDVSITLSASTIQYSYIHFNTCYVSRMNTIHYLLHNFPLFMHNTQVAQYIRQYAGKSRCTKTIKIWKAPESYLRSSGDLFKSPRRDLLKIKIKITGEKITAFAGKGL